jgi:bifunctional non-homologous end joining protein LigD
MPVPDRLDQYRAKRDPRKTPEPFGEVGVAGDGSAGRFVIQQHDATRLHWDLRLEHDGTLPSWALPRGVPWTPEQDHLAVRTEDHPLEYLTFHGDIPAGEYGAGRMVVWDQGTHEVEKWEERKVVVVLHGERARGRYALFATRGRDWMIHRMDPPEDPARRPPPTDLAPMGAVVGEAPTGEGWAWEARWSGLRVLVTNEPGLVRIASADGDPLDDLFPELRRIGRAIGSPEVVLDGFVVDAGAGAVDARLRKAGASASTIRRLVTDRPVRLVLFDLLWWEGHPVLDRPWHERRALLDALPLDDGGGPWATPTASVRDGADLVDAARAGGVDALVAKRVDSPYSPGAATGDWVEVRLAPAGKS